MFETESHETTEKRHDDTEIRNLVLSNKVGAVIMIGCLIMTSALIALLFLQTSSLNSNPQVLAHDKLLQSLLKSQPLLSTDIQIRAILEHDAQFLRTKRAQSLVSARLFVQSVSIMSGISLLIMGSAFVFARIKMRVHNLAFNLDQTAPPLI